MAEMVVSAAVGAIASELLRLVITEAKKVKAFKYVSKELVSTMEEILPTVTQIESMQEDDGKELKDLTDTIEKAHVLVQECLGVNRWRVLAKSRYTTKVKEINKKMLEFCQVKLQLIMHRNQLQDRNSILFLSNQVMLLRNQVLPCNQLLHSKQLLRSNQFHFSNELLPNNQLFSSNQLQSRPLIEATNNNLQVIKKKLDLLNIDPPRVFRDLCSVPKLDKVFVGLDRPLSELKKKLLDDSVNSLVVTAPPGCGKTTLVIQLCEDEEIKGVFKHIFFNVVSSAPNFRVLVQNLFMHNGYKVRSFENDSQALVSLEKLLHKLRRTGPVLLVLDDVWPGTEVLLENVRINLPGYKILVTSRCEFPSFGPTYDLQPLEYEDAKALLVRWAPRPDGAPQAEYEDLLQKILKRCNGFPIVIEVVGVSLKGRSLNTWKDQVESWSEGETMKTNVLERLQPSFNALELHLQECFLDMGSFLEDQEIRASVIIDIWMELYGTGNILCMKYLEDLAFQNLLEVVYLGRNEHEDGFNNELLVTQHGILRELTIYQNELEAVSERKRLNLEIREDLFPDWCLDLKQPINARLLSISTDDLFSSTWVEMDFPNVEALVLNTSSSNYALPSFIATMEKLKVVIIINHGAGPVKLTNFSCLGSLPNLKRMRLEKASITLLDSLHLQLCSLEKLSLFMCNFGEVFYDAIEEIDFSVALPNIQEIDIDSCSDLVELPYWVSEAVSLKTLSITNCNDIFSLSGDLGNLSKLEVLRLYSCINLSELPETTKRLSNLRFLDISNCTELSKLPQDIGKLQKLKKISMSKCWRCELPESVRYLEDLEVKCDDETAFLWEIVRPIMRNLRVNEEETELTSNVFSLE